MIFHYAAHNNMTRQIGTLIRIIGRKKKRKMESFCYNSGLRKTGNLYKPTIK